MQHLQGDLQAVFDALYELGVIEPVLAMDWKPKLAQIERGNQALTQAVRIINECGQDRAKLRIRLNEIDRGTLEMIAMEVAREYAGYHTRHEDLH